MLCSLTSSVLPDVLHTRDMALGGAQGFAQPKASELVGALLEFEHTQLFLAILGLWPWP